MLIFFQGCGTLGLGQLPQPTECIKCSRRSLLPFSLITSLLQPSSTRSRSFFHPLLDLIKMLFAPIILAASLVVSSNARVVGIRRADILDLPATIDVGPGPTPIVHIPLNIEISDLGLRRERGLDALSVLATVPLLASQSLVKVKAQPVIFFFFPFASTAAKVSKLTLSFPRQTIVVPSKAVGSLLSPVVGLLTSVLPGVTALPAVNTIANSLVGKVTSLAPALEPVGTIVSHVLPTGGSAAAAKSVSKGDSPASPAASSDSGSSSPSAAESSPAPESKATPAPQATPAPAGGAPAKGPNTLLDLSLLVLNPL